MRSLLLAALLAGACGPDPGLKVDASGPAADAADPDRPDAGPRVDAGPVTARCSDNVQDILVIDFRSGWWAGGGGASFFDVALPVVTGACDDVNVEYLHFEVDFLWKCNASSGMPLSCNQISIVGSASMTYDDLLAFFDKPRWDDYTQLWILSGSNQDPADINITTDFWTHFIAESKTSCIPLFVGAGDGFIDHGNALAAELDIGNILTTEFASPGFFTVMSFADPTAITPITVDSYMNAGAELTAHTMFMDVDRIADRVSVARPEHPQNTHGDSIVPVLEGGAYEIIAHDTSGRPAIAVGEIPTDNPEEPRPIVIDAGFQRFYSLADEPGTRAYLQNVVKYLSSVGCRAIIL